jgi:uncharacterized membrane protein
VDSLVDWLVSLVAVLPKWWAVFILSMVPIIELRGAIPLAIAWQMEPVSGFLAAFIGNIIPVLPLLLFLGPVSRWLEAHFRPFKVFFRWVFTRAARYEEQIQKYGYWGLIIYVGIPLPGTGAWTGCALAFLLGLKIVPAFLAIVAGVFMAGIIMLVLSLGVAGLAAQGIGWVVLAPALIILIVYVNKRRQGK